METRSTTPPPTRRPADAALRALDRFGLGARPGEPGRLGDPRGWLEDQIADRAAPMTSAGALPTSAEIGTALGQLRAAQRDPNETAAARLVIRQIAEKEATAALTERVVTERPFVERLVAFWSNHLCVSIAAKVTVVPLAGHYEREAIRPHALGRFEDLVLASARHPAMLLYLDNAQSIGPDSRGGRFTEQRGAARGLNENYARELLELHTLGVDGGYSQEDVVELARALTGWTVAGADGPMPDGGRRRGRRGRRAGEGPPVYPEAGFRFAPELHEPGARTVLGVRYEDGGEAQGEAVIRDLCRHPSTARFVAGKLVRHFVADEPPEDAVERIAGLFRDTGGDLREVARGLVRLDAAWNPANRKFRTPQEWLVAGLRALGAREFPAPLAVVLRDLRHPLWAPPSPQGYGDTRGEWADPDALMNRAELAKTIADRVARAPVDPTDLLETIAVDEDSPLPALLADETIEKAERIALALAGPDFQWR